MALTLPPTPNPINSISSINIILNRRRKEAILVWRRANLATGAVRQESLAAGVPRVKKPFWLWLKPKAMKKEKGNIKFHKNKRPMT